MSDNFLIQTSIDYDMPLEEVKRIAKICTNAKDFYEM